MYFDVTIIFGRNIGEKKAFIEKVKSVMDELDGAFYVDTLDNGLRYRYGYDLDGLAERQKGRIIINPVQGNHYDALYMLLSSRFDVFIDITQAGSVKRDIILAEKPVKTKSFAEIDRENEASMWS